MLRRLIILLLIVGCVKEGNNITEIDIIHEHDDGTTHSHDNEHFTCIWGTNALFYEDGSPVINPNWALGTVVIRTPVDTIYYHAPDSNNAISQCTADAYYDEMENNDTGQEQSSGDTVNIEFDDIIIADDNGNSIETGVPSKYCTCEAGVLHSTSNP